jgi:hypothetical protein
MAVIDEALLAMVSDDVLSVVTVRELAIMTCLAAAAERGRTTPFGTNELRLALGGKPSKGSISRCVSHLVRLGLLDNDPCKDNQTKRDISLTPLGFRIMERLALGLPLRVAQGLDGKSQILEVSRRA